MKLPNGDKVNPSQINEKLTTYILKEDHKDGKHKALLFKSILGITLNNKYLLIEALIKIAKEEDICHSENSPYGKKYVIDFLLTTPDGFSIIRSAWIILNKENYPRLTTVYPLK
ncbi:DUF6883 domain-containing protein [Cyanobacterium sp. DS4]|uniref:DUF6883 domain-containing protein n=1 Tax=Cyanobacterium sp. DS4 TaxID=2878255 RepID=UPI002E8004A7|nr:DUF6883 domain-containing protein [Cyanobacterium sp. Dongsha4]WVK99085.1 hypothetical protein Dongsha4_10260 [Cyanobacterium sp. Dongsha4]